MGVKKSGKIVALQHTLHWDAGASAEYGANVVNAVGLSATGPYRVPNVKIDSVCVYTNMPPCGAYRGFGYSEFHFGLESHMTRIAQAIAKRMRFSTGGLRFVRAIGLPLEEKGMVQRTAGITLHFRRKHARVAIVTPCKY